MKTFNIQTFNYIKHFPRIGEKNAFWVKKDLAMTVRKSSFFLSLLSDSNQRPRDYKSRALANWAKEARRESSLHRAATTNYLCCGQALEDLKGASRTALSQMLCKITIILLYNKTFWENYLIIFRYGITIVLLKMRHKFMTWFIKPAHRTVLHVRSNVCRWMVRRQVCKDFANKLVREHLSRLFRWDRSCLWKRHPIRGLWQ